MSDVMQNHKLPVKTPSKRMGGWGVPNLLTACRILLIPVLVICFYWPSGSQCAAWVFAAACATDWLDGALARYLEQRTSFGAFLDPVADKLIVAVALVLLVSRSQSAWLALPACVIVGREIAVSALREWMAQLGQQASVAVGPWGKIKTAVQMVSITWLLATVGSISWYAWWVGVCGLHIAAFLTLWSMWIYLRLALPVMWRA